MPVSQTKIALQPGDDVAGPDSGLQRSVGLQEAFLLCKLLELVRRLPGFCLNVVDVRLKRHSSLRYSLLNLFVPGSGSEVRAKPRQ